MCVRFGGSFKMWTHSMRLFNEEMTPCKWICMLKLLENMGQWAVPPALEHFSYIKWLYDYGAKIHLGITYLST